MSAALEVVAVPCLQDNYAWLVHDPVSGETRVIDPGEAAPVLDAAGARGWSLGAVWITHWHADHTGGIAGVRAAAEVEVVAPAAERAKIPGADRYVAPGDPLALGDHRAVVIATPGHTAGHVAFHLPDDRVLFTGDTLFAMGCGRLFEGTADDLHASFGRFAAMPDDTRVYAGHEYTLGNARFAHHAERDNAAITARLAHVERARARGGPTLPTSLGEERATNPFLRAPDAATLARLRAAKDQFRG